MFGMGLPYYSIFKEHQDGL